MISEGEYVEWYEQSVEQLVCQHGVEAHDTKTEDILYVVEMVQVLSHQPLQTAPVQVAAQTHTHTHTHTH